MTSLESQFSLWIGMEQAQQAFPCSACCQSASSLNGGDPNYCMQGNQFLWYLASLLMCWQLLLERFWCKHLFTQNWVWTQLFALSKPWNSKEKDSSSNKFPFLWGGKACLIHGFSSSRKCDISVLCLLASWGTILPIFLAKNKKAKKSDCFQPLLPTFPLQRGLRLPQWHMKPSLVYSQVLKGLFRCVLIFQYQLMLDTLDYILHWIKHRFPQSSELIQKPANKVKIVLFQMELYLV